MSTEEKKIIINEPSVKERYFFCDNITDFNQLRKDHPNEFNRIQFRGRMLVSKNTEFIHQLITNGHFDDLDDIEVFNLLAHLVTNNCNEIEECYDYLVALKHKELLDTVSSVESVDEKERLIKSKYDKFTGTCLLYMFRSLKIETIEVIYEHIFANMTDGNRAREYVTTLNESIDHILPIIFDAVDKVNHGKFEAYMRIVDNERLYKTDHDFEKHIYQKAISCGDEKFTRIILCNRVRGGGVYHEIDHLLDMKLITCEKPRYNLTTIPASTFEYMTTIRINSWSKEHEGLHALITHCMNIGRKDLAKYLINRVPTP